MNTAICADFTRAVGGTPLVRLQRDQRRDRGRTAGQMESMSPLGSIKDRVAVAMVDDAEERGILQPGGTIVEPTSGNTGIGLAFVSASRGYTLILTMPESMSIERRKLLIHLGATLVLTPAAEGMKGAIARAREIRQQTPGAWMPDQFANPANPAMHRSTTGPEIWQQCGGRIDGFVAGVGTGGTISGAGGWLKEQNPALHIVAVEPAASPVLSGGAPGPHKIQGIGAGFVPELTSPVGLCTTAEQVSAESSNSAGTCVKRKPFSDRSSTTPKYLDFPSDTTAIRPKVLWRERVL
jgi:cysteine synthase